jgi:spoIIIJ-associated protein
MLYEDDFEFEEQPADLRDRAIGGRSGGRNGGNRRRPPTRRGQIPEAQQEVPDQAKPARDLLADILQRMGIGPVDIGYISRPEGEYLEVNGPDLAALIGRYGNTLEALNLVFNNAFNAGVKNNRHYYTIDAEGYRAHRADQLKRLAIQTVERCVRNRAPQKLEPMLPSERKIIHLTLADSDLVRTESEGEEPERRVVIFPR